MTKYYVDQTGNYIGGFVGEATPPAGAIEVPNAPAHGTDTWNGSAWVPDPAATTLIQRLTADEQDRVSCKLDPQIVPLVDMDKAGWIAWAGTNFPSLSAAERTRLGMLFWVVSVGVRRSIRNGG